MQYPYKIRIKDQELDKIVSRLANDRTVTISGNKSPIRLFNQKIRPIRDDIFIGYDRKTYESNISLKNPFLSLSSKKNGKKHYKDFTFYLKK